MGYPTIDYSFSIWGWAEKLCSRTLQDLVWSRANANLVFRPPGTAPGAHGHVLMGLAREHMLMGLAHGQMLMGLAHEHMPMGLAHEHVLMGLAPEHTC